MRGRTEFLSEARRSAVERFWAKLGLMGMRHPVLTGGEVLKWII